MAIGLAGLTMATNLEVGPREASGFAAELVRLLESVRDPELTAASLEGGKIAAALQIAQIVIELTDGKPNRSVPMSVSPMANAMAIRGTCRWSLGLPGWQDDYGRANDMADAIAPALRSGAYWHVYLMAIPNGVLLPGPTALSKAAEIYSAAEQFGEEIAVEVAKTARGITLVYREGAERDTGASLLQELHETARQKRFAIPNTVPLIDIHVAREKARLGDVDGAIELARAVFGEYLHSGEVMWLGVATAVLVKSLLHRGFDADVREARGAISKLTAVPTEPGFVLYEIWLRRLRSLLAQAEGDEVAYRNHRDAYRKMAADLGFEGHMAMSEATS